MISMTCACKGEFWVRDRLVGTSTPCPSCGLDLAVPSLETVRASMSPAGCSCGEIFWSSYWQPKKLTKCPICGDVVGPSKSDGETTVILSTGSGEATGSALKTKSRPGLSVHSQVKHTPQNHADKTTAAITKERQHTVGPRVQGRRLGMVVGAVFLLVVGVLFGAQWASYQKEGSALNLASFTTVVDENGDEIDDKPEVVDDRGPPAPLEILVPAYIFPAAAGLDDWKRIIDAASRVPIVAVVNPASGPGEAPISEYSDLVHGATGIEGLTLIGYVSTDYAKRPRSEVEAEIDRWVQFYPEIQGIFLDMQSEFKEDEISTSMLRNMREEQLMRLLSSPTQVGSARKAISRSRPPISPLCLKTRTV